MSKLLELRERIRAVENIERITRTLATVAAARLSRTRRRAAGLREYSAAFREILAHQRALLAGAAASETLALLRARDPVRRVGVLVVSADRGMCGGYNLETNRLALEVWQREKDRGREVRFVAVGRRGAKFLARRHADVVHREEWRREGATEALAERLLSLLLGLWRSGEVDEVHAVYTEFHSAIQRRTTTLQLLPIPLERLVGEGEGGVPARWEYEPASADVLEELVETDLRVQLFALLLQSHASEQGARMITMEEASERADKALRGYRVQHNRVRREGITTELLGALFAARAIGRAAPGAARPSEVP